jgi:hypothetical protein
MLLIYTVKPSKRLGSDKGKKKSTLKVKYPLSFEIWIFRNGQSYCDEVCSDIIIITNGENSELYSSGW